MATQILKNEDFDNITDGMFKKIRVKIQFKKDYVGGLPATDEQLKAYIQHHLGKEGDEIEAEFKRIKKEELGIKPDNNEGDEIKAEKTYSVNSCYRDQDGFAWIPDFQIKACMKHALSDLNLFVQKKGTKGTIAELGGVLAHAESNGGESHRVYFTNDGEKIDARIYRTFRGSVSTPQGRTSIVHTNEIIQGAQAEFIIKWFVGGRAKLTFDDLKKALGLMRSIGLGSAKSYETGQFDILECEEL